MRIRRPWVRALMRCRKPSATGSSRRAGSGRSIRSRRRPAGRSGRAGALAQPARPGPLRRRDPARRVRVSVERPECRPPDRRRAADGPRRVAAPRFVKAQLLAADGKPIVLDEDGDLGLGIASPEKFQAVAKWPLLASVAWTPPTGHRDRRGHGPRRSWPATVSTCAIGASSWRSIPAPCDSTLGGLTPDRVLWAKSRGEGRPTQVAIPCGPVSALS